MALLTIPSVTKGTAVSVSLNKTDLFALAAVAADAYFSDSDNVKRCVVEFNSDPGNQRKILSFDPSQASPSASLLISSFGRDSYLLERLVLEDNDGGVMILERSQLPSGFDISLGGGGGGGGGGPITFSGSAKTWGIKTTNGQSATLGATAVVDTISYTISGGMMSMSYELDMPSTSGNIEGPANLAYGIPLPSGYAFGDLSAFTTFNVTYRGTPVSLKLLTNGSLPVTTENGLYQNVSGTPLPAQFSADSVSNLILIRLPTAGGPSDANLVDSVYGSLTYSVLKIKFTVTNVPVVTV